MENDLKRFLALRDAIAREKSQIERRLAEIERVLSIQSAAGLRDAARFSAGSSRGGRKGRLSLREAVLLATAHQALTKQEILDAVRAMGYRFTTRDPMNSLGVILYGRNPRFINEDGRFRPASNPGAQAQPEKPARKRPPLSAEARARIAAAQRARWERARGQEPK